MKGHQDEPAEKLSLPAVNDNQGQGHLNVKGQGHLKIKGQGQMKEFSIKMPENRHILAYIASILKSNAIIFDIKMTHNETFPGVTDG